MDGAIASALRWHVCSRRPNALHTPTTQISVLLNMESTVELYWMNDHTPPLYAVEHNEQNNYNKRQHLSSTVAPNHRGISWASAINWRELRGAIDKLRWILIYWTGDPSRSRGECGALVISLCVVGS